MKKRALDIQCSDLIGLYQICQSVDSFVCDKVCILMARYLVCNTDSGSVTEKTTSFRCLWLFFILIKPLFCSQIVTDLKYTRVEELRTQLEVAFSEVQRLQKLVRSQSEELCHWRNLQQARANKKKNDPEFMELVRRVKTLGQVIKSMDEQKKELIARNDFLVNRMHQLLANDNSSGKDFDKGR